jgi:putative DNA methylase
MKAEARSYPKRLIEVDLPIRRISEHGRREKLIRHGHISTLHIWWARRPLAACRAVLCASLWPDPADPDCPPGFVEAARTQMLDWTNHERLRMLSLQSQQRFNAARKQPELFDNNIELRKALLDFIADFANWDNASNSVFLATSRHLTQKSHEVLGGAPGSRPLVIDPFAGGGSIPLEALRIGADAYASDLNPVPVLLNKFCLETIPKHGLKLAEEVRKWGRYVSAEAEKTLGDLYSGTDSKSTTVAFLWARTIVSEAPSPNELAVEVPLLRTLWLSKRKDFKRALRWVKDAQGHLKCDKVQRRVGCKNVTVLRPVLEVFSPTTPAQVAEGTVKGGAATCPVSGFTTSATRVKEQLKEQQGGANAARLYALYVEEEAGREFRVATSQDLAQFEDASSKLSTVLKDDPTAVPTETINPIRPYKNTRGISAVTRIGCNTFGDLYNARQLLCIHSFYGALRSLRANASELSPEMLVSVETALALAINRLVSQNTSVSRWDASRLTIKGAFSKQALAVVWDFAEANPFSGGTGGWEGAVDWVAKFIVSNSCITQSGAVAQASATELPLPADSASALITDPPYFAAIPYGDLSDFFYVWLKRGMGHVFPELFRSNLTLKDEELIVTNAQRDGSNGCKDESFFRVGMTKALRSARDAVEPHGVGVVVYAEGTTAGWEAILSAIIDSGWVVTSSWPIDTEMENRTQAQGSASLQSSVHIVCRPRENADGSVRDNEVGDWRDVLAELPQRIHDWMPRLSEEGVVGADAIFACLGPALEIFSRYSRVEKASGEVVSLSDYLEHVWAAVSKEALSVIFDGASTEGFEPDARLTAMWLWTIAGSTSSETTDTADEDADDSETVAKKAKKMSGFALEYDAARKIAQGLGAHLEDLRHLVESSGETARLLPVSERTTHLFGKTQADDQLKTRKSKKKDQQLDLFAQLADETATEETWAENTVSKVGDTTLDRVHQSMILFAANRSEALKRFLVEDGAGKDPKFWRLAQALSALYPSQTDEKRWVDGVLARKKGLGL